MKYLKYVSSLLLVMLSSVTFGQTGSSLLWEISGNGLEKPSYLFGTIHLKCPDDLTISENVKEVFAQTDQLVLELDMDDPNFMVEAQQQSVNASMKNLSTELSQEELAAMNTFFKKHYGADMTQLGILKPFALLSMVLPKGLDCETPASYEGAFMELAQAEEEEVLGLETLEDQFSIFDKVPVKEQYGWVLHYVNDEEKLKEDISKMIASYDTQDVDEVLAIMKDFPEYEDLMEDLLYKRNEKWVAKIEGFAKEKPTLFAVGAAHLGSERGVIALLQKAGYKVKPIQD